VLLREIVEVSRRVAEVGSRREKTASLAELLRSAGSGEVGIAVAYLSGELPQGRLGVGPAMLRASMPGVSTADATISLSEADDTCRRIAAASGAGSAGEKSRLLHDLLVRATPAEQRFLGRLILGEIRQGALSGIMAEAIARAAGVSAPSVRRALMFSGDLSEVARAALFEGETALARFSIQLFRPVQPMLADAAEDVTDALERLDGAVFEYKLDGARVQVHRDGSDVRVYTRRLNEVSHAVPELIEAVRALPVNSVVLDGEALALRPDGRPHPFQTTMRRFGRRADVDAMRDQLPLSAYYFDILLLDGESLVDRPMGERIAALAEAATSNLIIPRITTSDREEAARFLDSALAAGHEGLVAKELSAAYEAGRRGRAWLKLKRAHTLDLVVLAAEWGSGRRRGWLSNLHLGARDPESGSFIMLGKTFKGMTDEVLRWQTQKLQQLEIARDEWTVFVRPELIAEIAFDGVQASPRYPGGLALRFARLKRYRQDKRPEEADTIEAVRRIYTDDA
jgi:DNA ligase-1